MLEKWEELRHKIQHVGSKGPELQQQDKAGHHRQGLTRDEVPASGCTPRKGYEINVYI